jgi:hypothetical protein
MAFDRDRINLLTERWQGILRLCDWDIELRMVETEWRKTGDIKIDAHDRKAILMINAKNPKQENAEEVVIHELLHLKLSAMDQLIEQLLEGLFRGQTEDPRYGVIYGQYMTITESTVEDLAKGFLALGGEDKRLSFGRVGRLADEELKKGTDTFV